MSCRKRTKPDRRGVTDTLGERLCSWRERCNFSQSEAALKLNVLKRPLQEWEQGRATPAHLALVALESVIGGSIKSAAGQNRKRSRKRLYTCVTYTSHGDSVGRELDFY